MIPLKLGQENMYSTCIVANINVHLHSSVKDHFENIIEKLYIHIYRPIFLSFIKTLAFLSFLCCRQLIKFLVDKCSFDFSSVLRDESRENFNVYRYIFVFVFMELGNILKVIFICRKHYYSNIS